MCSAETQPLCSVKELWEWEKCKLDKCLVGKPLQHYRGKRDGPGTLICHDMRGGYLPEDGINGCKIVDCSCPYVMMHWWYVDVFTYFSHSFITIPPVGWINQAHMHGVLVLGTFITEWTGGENTCKQIFKNTESVEWTVAKMVAIAVAYNFEGWLINIENKVENDHIDRLLMFLTLLTKEMKKAIGERSLVIWYDAVTVDGKLNWQNELNEKNMAWFDVTDGIFLNYPWKPHQLSISAERAGGRRHNVYAGIDCFGRGSCGGGGWNCHEALSHVRKFDLSVALFAPGWVAETLPHCDLVMNSLRFWDRLATLLSAHPVTSLPVKTDFSLGFMQDEKDCRFYNMTHSQLQPFYLESGAFPRTRCPSIVLPGQGCYKLFKTDLILTGDYKVEVESDSSLQLLIWLIDDGRNLPVVVEHKDENKDGELSDELKSYSLSIDDKNGAWILRFENIHLQAIGLRSSDVAIVKSFSMKEIPTYHLEQFSDRTQEISNNPKYQLLGTQKSCSENEDGESKMQKSSDVLESEG